MGTIYIFIFSGNASFVGDKLNSLGGDEACADIDLNQCILSLMHKCWYIWYECAGLCTQ